MPELPQAAMAIMKACPGRCRAMELESAGERRGCGSVCFLRPYCDWQAAEVDGEEVPWCVQASADRLARVQALMATWLATKPGDRGTVEEAIAAVQGLLREEAAAGGL